MKALADKKLVISAKKYAGESVVVSARLPVELVRELDHICKKTGRNRNEIIQMCLEFSLENTEVER